MLIFGTVGVIVRYIPLPSGVIAMLRGAVGAFFLLVVMLLKKRSISVPDVKRNLLLLSLSGACIGANWMLLFEAYRYTTLATATLCYYLAPVFVILASPLVLKEKLNGKKLACVAAALLGMVLVSGVLQGKDAASNPLGVLLSIGAAVLYACVMLLNKRLSSVPTFDRTIVQMVAAALVLLPYTLAAGQLSGLSLSPATVVNLAIICILHTGIAYFLYFSSVRELKAQTMALFSYIDAVVALLASALVFGETLDLYGVVGAILILGATFISERSDSGKNRGAV